MAQTASNRNVLVACLDTVKQKNLYQFRGLAQHGWRFSVITTDSLDNSADVGAKADNVEVYSADRSRVRRTMIHHLTRLLRTRRFAIAELYPGSHLALLMAFLIKRRGIPLVIVARGEEYYYLTGQMSRAQERSFRLTYRLADHVVYKETYMEEMLERFGKKSIWMLPNAVPMPEFVREHRPAKCTLLYMNSMKDFRHPDVPLRAFLQIAEQLGLDAQSSIRLRIVGFQGDSASDPSVRKREAALREMVEGRDVPVDLLPWSTEPREFLESADVFLLPADVVFLNYSLLEAMSRGVPAIVQETDASDRIVTHGQQGYVLPLDVDTWRTHMLSLIQDYASRAEMGRSARERVQETYSLESYSANYDRIYREILSPESARVARETVAR